MSPFDLQLADDFQTRFEEFKEEVIRRIGGNPASTEPVMAVVEIDSKAAGTTTDGGGLIDNPDRGKWIEQGGLLELAAEQEETPQDAWVIRGQVWQQVGGPIGADGGSKTIQLVRRVGLQGRKPNI